MPTNTIILGDNILTDCDSWLAIEGEEVFRLRERLRDGQLIVDFDLRAEDGSRIAKIAVTHVVFVAPGYEFKNVPGVSEVTDVASGEALARVEQRSLGQLAITGTFWVNDLQVVVNERGLMIGGNRISGSRVIRSGRGIGLTRDTISLG